NLYVDATTGDTLQSWWQGAPPSGVSVTAENIGQTALDVFTTMTVGSRFAMTGWQQGSDGQSYALIQVGDVDHVVSPMRAEGDTARKGDYLTMQYTGWKWSDGSQFDSSWERGAPFGFVLGQGQVITGWDESLVDAAVGSQLMLVIPPSEAYGDQGELAGETLIFVVDVLDAARPAD